MQYIHSIEYYSALKEMKLCQGTTWINPKDMLSEISKKQKGQMYDSTFFGYATRLLAS